jgi:hypothetical protein
MKFHGSPEAEADALRRAAERAGCQVRALAVKDTPAGRRAVGTVVCDDGWGAARMLVAATAEDAVTDGARALAALIRQEAPDDESYARAIQAFVKGRVRFAPEVGEIFQNGGVTLALGVGDCDDHARLVQVLAIAGGLPSAMAFLHRGEGPTHAVAVLCPSGECSFAETTVDADYGEHPNDAAKRLRLVDERTDLAREVVIMSEDDLPPVPSGFAAANPSQEQLELDASALNQLGYVVESEAVFEPVEHPAMATWFRRAVARAQMAANGAAGPVDGLIGKRTREWIASRLPPDDFGMGYIARVRGIGNVAVKHTADLPDQFFSDLKRYASELDIDPVWMIEVIFSESGLRSTAAYRQAPHFASGIIGFIDVKQFGYPDNSRESHDLFIQEVGVLRQLSGARDFWRNAVALAKKYGHRIESAANLYQYTFVPMSFERGMSDDTVIVAKGGTGYRGQEDMFYRVNAGYLDVDKDGAITVGDLRERIEKSKRDTHGNILPRYAEAIARLQAAGPNAPPAEGGGGGVVAGLLAFAAIGTAFYFATRA